MTPSDVIPDYG
ncbi:hypothetical protein TNCT_467711, partial [Trichonephila clavata]